VQWAPRGGEAGLFFAPDPRRWALLIDVWGIYFYHWVAVAAATAQVGVIPPPHRVLWCGTGSLRGDLAGWLISPLAAVFPAASGVKLPRTGLLLTALPAAFSTAPQHWRWNTAVGLSMSAFSGLADQWCFYGKRRQGRLASPVLSSFC